MKNSRSITSAVGARKRERRRMRLDVRGKAEFVGRVPPDIHGFADSEIGILLRQLRDTMRAVRQPGFEMNTVSEKGRGLDDSNRGMRNRSRQAARDPHGFGPHAGAVQPV